MRSVKQKLIVANISVVLFSALVISVPLIKTQYTKQISDTKETAESKVTQAYTDINLFLRKPVDIVTAVTYYIQTHQTNPDAMESFFGKLLSGENIFSQLYYSGTVPFKDGGFFYSSDKWQPDADYDQTTRAWYTVSRENSGICISNPYIDIVTKEPVAAVSQGIRINGTFRGVVGLDIQLKSLNAMIAPVKLSKSGRSFLLDKNGMYVTNSDPKKLLNTNFFTEYNLSKFQNEIKSHDVFFKLETGTNLYFAARRISEDSGWTFVTIGQKKDLYELVTRNIFFIIALSLIGISLAFLISILLAHQIVKPLKIVDTTMQRIATGDADLTQRIKVTSNDEISSMVVGFNKFTDKLHLIIKDIKQSKEVLSAAGESLQSSTDDTASSITQILANISGMHQQIEKQSSSVEETAGAVNEIASNISSLERMIATQSAGVTQASAAVEQMIGNIASVNSSIEKMASSFDELQTNAQNGSAKQQDVNERIEQIENQSQMLQEANQVIANIANQTNLLAMNAAIEAAHAGNAGKGFSVVADEIRKLSETSTTQSKTIGTQLNNIKGSINTVVEASAESSTAFASVSEKIKDTDELVRQIKSAMMEQTEGSKQIRDALHSMNDSTSEVRTASSEMSEGNKAILQEIKYLQDETSVMKDSMNEMSIGAKKINQTGATLNDISEKMKNSIAQIGEQIDQFKI